MTRCLLTVSEADADAAITAASFDEVFFWSRSARSSFTGTLSPYLESLGPVNPRNVDLVRIALGALATDRSVLREGGGASWNTRDLELTVQVDDPTTWSGVAGDLAILVGFLSGDRWAFTFTQAPADTVEPLPLPAVDYQRTVLLSGGADSAAGALISARQLDEGSSQALVSQYSSTALSPIQQGLGKALGGYAPRVAQIHHQFHINRGSRRLDGSIFRDEPSTRSRSLLFLSLGLAVASCANVPLWIAENGFASLNPSLGADRRGALSTHTTHPRFLRDLQALVERVGGHGHIENPFESLTKGEMFALVAEEVGTDASSAYLSATNSCSHTDARYSGAQPGSSCGVCFGCLVRRAAFAAAGIPDRTEYLCDDTTGRFTNFVQQKSIVDPMCDFAIGGIRPRDVMAMSLPADYAATDALHLCRRGADELRSFFA
ncbi:MAG: 7-cyano-7-deazaguanine synthase [Humibacillus sp.]|nr:7-cyano-7-deazaguanine synthase [Humibacillus sp.]MDN5779656.1 7-cyano-7-deazaguanine synthase [Humibacillus sp.]